MPCSRAADSKALQQQLFDIRVTYTYGKSCHSPDISE